MQENINCYILLNPENNGNDRKTHEALIFQRILLASISGKV